MTEHINTGGPAFHCESENNGRKAVEGFNHDWIPAGTTCQYRGMTMRDYFAAKALPAIYSDAMRDSLDRREILVHDDWRTGLALDAYAMADAMLRARDGE